jgi:hypothetical protein
MHTLDWRKLWDGPKTRLEPPGIPATNFCRIADPRSCAAAILYRDTKFPTGAQPGMQGASFVVQPFATLLYPSILIGR